MIRNNLLLAILGWTSICVTATGCDSPKQLPEKGVAASTPKITLPCANSPAEFLILGINHPGQVINIVQCPDGGTFGTPDQPYTMVAFKDHYATWRLRNFSGKELWAGINFIEPTQSNKYGCVDATAATSYWPKYDAAYSTAYPNAKPGHLGPSADGSSFLDLVLKPENEVSGYCSYYRYQILLYSDANGMKQVGAIEPELIVEGRP